MTLKLTMKKVIPWLYAFLLLIAFLIGLTRLSIPKFQPSDPINSAGGEVHSGTPLPVQTTPSPTSALHGTLATSPIAMANETQIYQHPLGFFHVPIPIDWKVNEETEDWVQFTEPDRGLTVDVRLTNTGLELDGAAFTRFIAARESDSFPTDEGYQESLSSIVPEEKRAIVEKKQEYGGLIQRITSCYRGIGQIIISVDAWSTSEDLSSPDPVGMEWADQIGLDTESIGRLDLYANHRNITGEDGLFRLSVPVAWTDQTTRREDAVVRDFISPDQHLVVQVLEYHYGETLTRSQAGRFALTLLPDLYASDLIVSSDRTRSDNLEYVTWFSESQQVQGTSYFSNRGEIFLLFTVMVDTEYASIYSTTISRLTEEFGI